MRDTALVARACARSQLLVGSLLAFDLATPAPTSTAATEALTELTELLEVHTGACTAQRRRRRSLTHVCPLQLRGALTLRW